MGLWWDAGEVRRQDEVNVRQRRTQRILAERGRGDVRCTRAAARRAASGARRRALTSERRFAASERGIHSVERDGCGDADVGGERFRTSRASIARKMRLVSDAAACSCGMPSFTSLSRSAWSCAHKGGVAGVGVCASRAGGGGRRRVR